MTEPGLPPGRQLPRTDVLGFDPRLMSAERLILLAGKHPMLVSEQGLPNVYLDCGLCGKAVEVLTDKRGGRYKITAGQLLSGVLRHLVMRHELPLSALGKEQDHG